MKAWQKPIVIMMTAAVMFFGWSTPILEANAQSSEFDQLSQTAQEMTLVEDEKVIEDVTNLTEASITNGDVITKAGKDSLDLDELNVAEITEDGETYTVASLPIVSEDYSPISNLTIILTDNKIATYTETLLSESEENTVIVASYTDGVLTNEEVTDLEFVNNEKVQEEIDKAKLADPDTIQTQGLTEVALCLSGVLLVDLAVARMVAGACMAACGTAVVPICAACIGGVFAIGGANIGAVVGCFAFN